MNLQECYEKFGGDYDGVMGRLRREQLVRKLLYKFLDDKNFELFEASMQRQEYDEALRAVHTLKGVCQNLSFGQLYESSSRITLALKEKDYGAAAELAPQLAADYGRVMQAIEEYQSSVEE